MTGTAALSAPQTCTRPPPTHASTRDSWTLMGKSGSVSCGVTAPFSWVLVQTRFCLCPTRVYFLVLCKFWQLCGGDNGDLLQEGLCHTQVCCTQSPCPFSSPLVTCTSSEDTQIQFDSKCDFTPPTIFLGLLLCPWTWDISSQSRQCYAEAAPAPTGFLGLLYPWT